MFVLYMCPQRSCTTISRQPTSSSLLGHLPLGSGVYPLGHSPMNIRRGFAEHTLEQLTPPPSQTKVSIDSFICMITVYGDSMSCYSFLVRAGVFFNGSSEASGQEMSAGWVIEHRTQTLRGEGIEMADSNRYSMSWVNRFLPTPVFQKISFIQQSFNLQQRWCIMSACPWHSSSRYGHLWQT